MRSSSAGSSARRWGSARCRARSTSDCRATTSSLRRRRRRTSRATTACATATARRTRPIVSTCTRTRATRASATRPSTPAPCAGGRYGYPPPNSADRLDMYKHTRDEGFGDEPKRRILVGTYALSAGYYDAYYGQAQKVRRVVAREHADAFERFDVLITPRSPTVAFETIA